MTECLNSEVLDALGSGRRRAMVWALRDHALPVHRLAEVVNVELDVVWAEVVALRAAGLVRVRRIELVHWVETNDHGLHAAMWEVARLRSR